MSATIQSALKPVTDDLLGYDESNLLEELGRRGKTLESDFTQMGNPALQPIEDAALLGPLDELKDLGWRIARRWILEIQKIVCGNDSEDKEDRNKLRRALQLSGSDLAAAVAAFLVSTFYIASPIAAVVAVILVKRLGGSALEEICKKSKEWVKPL